MSASIFFFLRIHKEDFMESSPQQDYEPEVSFVESFFFFSHENFDKMKNMKYH